MDRRGTERVGQSGGEGEGNVAKRGQAVTEVGQNQDRISNATDNVPPLPATPLFFFYSDQSGSAFCTLWEHLSQWTLQFENQVGTVMCAANTTVCQRKKGALKTINQNEQMR